MSNSVAREEREHLSKDPEAIKDKSHRFLEKNIPTKRKVNIKQ